jgi:hypothetical protein
VYVAMPAILRRLVSYSSGALIGDDELTTQECAMQANVSTETIRRWCIRYQIGSWNSRLSMYVVNKSKFERHLARRKKRVA